MFFGFFVCFLGFRGFLFWGGNVLFLGCLDAFWGVLGDLGERWCFWGGVWVFGCLAQLY